MKWTQDFGAERSYIKFIFTSSYFRAWFLFKEYMAFLFEIWIL